MRFASSAVATWLLLGTLSLAQSTPPKTTSLDSPQVSAAANTHSTMAPAKETAIQQLLDMVGTKPLMMKLMAEMEQNLRPLLANSFPPGVARDQLIELFLDSPCQARSPAASGSRGSCLRQLFF